MSVRRYFGRNFPVGLRDRFWRLIGGRHPRHTLRLRRMSHAFRYHWLPGFRSWHSDIRFNNHWTIRDGILQHTWRGVPMLKHPVEATLYPHLFWQVRPGTIFEIGTSSGGAAIYFSDMLRLFDIDCRILTMDVKVPDPPIRPDNVEFLYGDAGDIGKTLTPEKLMACARPWLVIEDSSHQYEHTMAVLRFFDPLMEVGEYLIVEDANVTHMGDEVRFGGGPGRAIQEFLRETGGRYEIDTTYCDRYGHNFTGNPNGYLRRVS